MWNKMPKVIRNHVFMLALLATPLSAETSSDCCGPLFAAASLSCGGVGGGDDGLASSCSRGSPRRRNSINALYSFFLSSNDTVVSDGWISTTESINENMSKCETAIQNIHCMFNISFPYPCLSGTGHSSFLPSVHHSTLRHGTDWRIFPRQWTAPCCDCSNRSPAGRWWARPLPSWWSSTESRQSSATSPPYSAKYINLVRFVAILVEMKWNQNWITYWFPSRFQWPPIKVPNPPCNIRGFTKSIVSWGVTSKNELQKVRKVLLQLQNG